MNNDFHLFKPKYVRQILFYFRRKIVFSCMCGEFILPKFTKVSVDIFLFIINQAYFLIIRYFSMTNINFTSMEKQEVPVWE